jgi:uncharacterized protein (DUF488 family)
MPVMKKKIWTVGHSTHSIAEFLKILKSFEISLLVDVRHYPGSKHCPQFGKERLKKSLAKAGIKYLHLVDLGGRRPPDKGMTQNLGWRSPQFRGYADYMTTPAFKKCLKELMELGQKQTTVIMCAEAVPWRCHRSLIGDALLAKGFQVEDIFSAGKSKPHGLTPFAKVYRQQVSYPSSLFVL